MPLPSGTEYKGTVKGKELRTEPNGEQVISFDLYRFNDPNGNPLPLIPVEIRGRRFEGFFNEERHCYSKGPLGRGQGRNPQNH